jgi:hypothetical protein
VFASNGLDSYQSTFLFVSDLYMLRVNGTFPDINPVRSEGALPMSLNFSERQNLLPSLHVLNNFFVPLFLLNIVLLSFQQT